MDTNDPEIETNDAAIEENKDKPDDDVVQEGSAVIVRGGRVFYNPVQEYNRDLSVIVITAYFQRLLKERAKKTPPSCNPTCSSSDANNESCTDTVKSENEQKYEAGKKYEDGLVILEALAATGLRSIRYAKEIAGIKRIIANDISADAVKSININVQHNQVEHLVESSHSDAMTLMYLSTLPEKNFDVIDLDPYGSPSRFLDAALQSIANGGLLLVTATDMAILAGNMPEACYTKYGSIPLRVKSCHEMALRILLYTIETTANRYGKYIEPLISLSIDFYIRVFVRVYQGANKCKYSMSKHSMIYNCTGCDTFTLHPLGIIKPNPTAAYPGRVKFALPTGPPVASQCCHCKHSHHIGGPIWSAPIHDMSFVEEVLEILKPAEVKQKFQTSTRMVGMMTVVHEELPDIPLYYSIDKLCNVLKLEIVPMLRYRSALLHAGYKVSYSHASKMSIKTDAPTNVIWDILRCWNKLHPVKEKRLIEGTPLKEILSKEPAMQYTFDKIHPQANPESRIYQLTRYQINPKAFWGPGRRATIMLGNVQEILPKSVVNQNRHQRALKKRFEAYSQVITEIGQSKLETEEHDNSLT